MFSTLVLIAEINMDSRKLLWPTVIRLFNVVDKQVVSVQPNANMNPNALVGSPFCNCLLDFVESSQLREIEAGKIQHKTCNLSLALFVYINWWVHLKMDPVSPTLIEIWQTTEG